MPTASGTTAAQSPIAAPAAADTPCRACAEELRRMARDIHDRIAAEVSLATRQLELHTAYLGSDRELAESRADAALLTLRGLTGSLRGILLELRNAESGEERQQPPVDLRAELGAFVDSLDHPLTAVRLDVLGDQRRVPGDRGRELVMIVREALQNCLNHASAWNVQARIEIGADAVRAVIEDDGQGFDMLIAKSARSGQGYGLTAMSDRVHALGGSLGVSSRPGLGARVRIRVPLVEPGR